MNLSDDDVQSKEYPTTGGVDGMSSDVGLYLEPRPLRNS